MPQQPQPTQLTVQNIDSFVELLRIGKNYKEALKYGANQYNVSQYKINKLRLQQIPELVNLIQVNYMNLERENDIKEEKRRTTWQANELKLFVWMCVCHSYLSNKPLQQYVEADWLFFTNVLTRKTANDLDFQSKSLFKNYKGNKEKWDEEEENILKAILEDQQNQNKWNEVSKMLYFKSAKKYYRSSQKCREYWFNHLDSRLKKSPWTVDEDIQLISELLIYGFKWSKLTQVIENTWGYRRTQHMVKNRTKYLCKKYGFKDQKEQGCMKELKLIDKRLRQQKSRIQKEGISVKQQENIELSYFSGNIDLYAENQKLNALTGILNLVQKDEGLKMKEENKETPYRLEQQVEQSDNVIQEQSLQSSSQFEEDYTVLKKPNKVFQKPSSFQQKTTNKRNVIILYHAPLQEDNMASQNDQSPQIMIGQHVEEHHIEDEEPIKESSYYDEYNIVEELPDQQIDLNDDIQFQHDTHGGKMRERVTHELAKFFPGCSQQDAQP